MKVCSEKYSDAELRRKLEKKLEPRRYEHSFGVAYTACSLFMAHGIDSPEELSRAYTAGLLHDCAKDLSEEERDRAVKKYGIMLSEIEKENPFLIHAKLGAVLAKEKYGVTDEGILSAIRWHTTGHAEMSFFESVIFSADFIEPNRKPLPCLPEIRSCIYTDIDKALYLILKQTLVHLEHKGSPVEEHTLEAFGFYKNRIGGRE